MDGAGGNAGPKTVAQCFDTAGLSGSPKATDNKIRRMLLRISDQAAVPAIVPARWRILYKQNKGKCLST